jgi:hypothetical protein
MMEISNTRTHIQRLTKLFEERKKILSLTPEKALNAILDSPQPAALVHSFPEEDFYFLIHDIGLEDSHLLLSLASDKQWEYLVDLEVWEKDKIEIQSITRWLDLLFKVDPNRFIKWFLHQKTDFLESYLFKNIEVMVRETDQDPSEFGDEFFTYDDTFYVRFLDDPFDLEPGEHESSKIIKKQRNDFLSKFFETLAAFDHVTYQNVLMESSHVIPAESEEEAYRQRNVRLAEKGFLPYEEAIGIYQPLKAQDFEKQSPKFTATDPERKLFLPVPLYPAGMLEKESLFTDALKRIEIDDVLEQVQTEFAGLCNQIIAADQKNIRERDELKSIVQKACGYLNVGLEQLIEDDRELDANRSAALIQSYPLSSIFKVGYGLALELKWRAEKWRKKSWFEKEGLLLSFWGEDWLGVLGGLLIKKPLFYDNFKTGVLYREFISVEDIKKTENALNEIIAFDELLSRMKIQPGPVANGFITYKNLVLTLWVSYYLGLPEEPLSITLDEFKLFFDDLWAGKDKPRKTSQSMKKLFLSWLSVRTGLTPYEISQSLGQTLENLFNELESEYGEVSKKDLDQRYISLFLIEKTKS